MKRLPETVLASFEQRLNTDAAFAELWSVFMDNIYTEAEGLAGQYGGKPDDYVEPATAAFEAGRMFADLASPDPFIDFVLLWLIKKGKLLSVSRCEVCGRWYLAGRRDQRACSARCRDSKWRQKPETKAHLLAYKRAEYKVWHSQKWARVPQRLRPTPLQYLEHGEPEPQEWLEIQRKKGRR